MSQQQIQLQTLTHDSMPSIHQLWQAAAKFDACGDSVLKEKIFGDSFVCDELRIGAFIADQFVGFAVGSIQHERSFVKLIAVAPQHQRMGTGSRLVNEIHAICRQHTQSIRIAESAPNYLCPGVDQRNQPAIRFFQKHGYVQFAEAFNQSVNVGSRDWSTVEDEQQIFDEHQVEFARATSENVASLSRLREEHWPSWDGEIQAALKNQPPTLHVATLARKVIGFAAHDANNRGTGWFGPMGTAPEHSGKGIGRVLLYRCLADIQQTQKHATIPWVGPLGFYEKLADAKLDRSFFRLEKRFGPLE